jgi:hypothetical protein
MNNPPPPPRPARRTQNLMSDDLTATLPPPATRRADLAPRVDTQPERPTRIPPSIHPCPTLYPVQPGLPTPRQLIPAIWDSLPIPAAAIHRHRQPRSTRRAPEHNRPASTRPQGHGGPVHPRVRGGLWLARDSVPGERVQHGAGEGAARFEVSVGYSHVPRAR